MNHTHHSPEPHGNAAYVRDDVPTTTEVAEARNKAWGVWTDSGRSRLWMVSLALATALLGGVLGAWVTTSAHGGAPIESPATTRPSPTSPAHEPERASATSSGPAENLATERDVAPNG